MFRESLRSGTSFTRKFGVAAFDYNWWRGSIGTSPNDITTAYVSVSPYQGTIAGVYKTTDTGNTWTNVLTLGNQNHDILTFVKTLPLLEDSIKSYCQIQYGVMTLALARIATQLLQCFIIKGKKM